MALSRAAMMVKKRMSGVVTVQRALEAMKQEWQELASDDRALGEELVWQLLLEKRQLQRQAAACGLKNWVLLRRAGITGRRLQLMKLRYVKGLSWTEVIKTMDRSKQHLMREHNRALEMIAAAGGGR